MRRRLLFFTPTALIAITGALSILGVVGQGLGLALQGCLVAFCLGQASIVIPEERRWHRAAIAHTEGFITWLHECLEKDEVPESQRESAELALSSAVQALDQLERATPPWTRWRERRARERAAR